MKIKPYVEKLEKSKEYVKFKEKYPNAPIIAGFFVLDFETGQNIHQIDFYVPSEKKVAAFTLDSKVSLQLLNLQGNKIPETLDINTNIDIDALKGILTDELKNRNISDEIRKMIAVVQTVKGKKIWNVNCVLSGMEIIKSHIEDDSKTILKLEKLSVSDIIKKMPAPLLQAQAQPAQTQIKPAKSNVKEEVEKLTKLEEAIEQEKQRLKKELEKEHGKKIKN